LTLNLATNLYWCTKSCETESSTLNSGINDCYCNDGYATLSLADDIHKCTANCDLISSTLNDVDNDCECRTGWTDLTIDPSKIYKWCNKTCEVSSTKYGA